MNMIAHKNYLTEETCIYNLDNNWQLFGHYPSSQYKTPEICSAFIGFLFTCNINAEYQAILNKYRKSNAIFFIFNVLEARKPKILLVFKAQAVC